jgi:hypothetical protein
VATKAFSSYNAILFQIRAALPLLANVGDVFDGPQGGTIPTDKDLVFVGCDDPLTSSTVLAIDIGQQDWMSIPDVSKMESFLIWSSYVAWTGDDNDFASCRARAEANIALIEAQFWANRTGGPNAPDGKLGTNSKPGPLAPTGWSNFYVSRLQQIATPAGPAVHIPFAIACATVLKRPT